MTREQLQQIRDRWLCSRFEASNCGIEQVGRAIGDIVRLLGEIDRLRDSCDEITRQYVRLCYGSSTVKPGDGGGAKLPKNPAA